MKKLFTKENIGTILFYILVYLFIYFLITNNQYFFGSTLDYQTQHYLIPEYFRTLFYETHDLFPDFAFHLGSGQNIYYFSYYGLLSPIIFISYLFPHISMLHYIIISTSIMVILSASLFYFYLKKNQHSPLVSFLGGLMLLCASPLIFHAHRHIMFINYMPFLIMGMLGVDRFFKEKKSGILILSCFFMIMTSYYYSVGGLITLFILGIYRYLEQNDFNFKQFIKKMISFAIPFIISVLMAMILLLPTLYTLLAGRGTGSSTISLLDLFIPSLSFKNILYSTYSMGVMAIVIISCGYFIMKGKKENKFLSSLILLFGCFPIFNYILNGTLYIDPKSLIPFLPLVIFVTCNFLKLLFEEKVDFKYLFKVIIFFLILGLVNLFLIWLHVTTGIGQGYAYLLDLLGLFIIFALYYKFRKKSIVAFYFIIVVVALSTNINLSDKLMKKGDFLNDDSIIEKLVKEDNDFYRINNLYLGGIGLNNISNSNQYISTLYSSAFNRNYNKFYFDVFNNAVTYRNRSMTAFSTNILFHNFNGEKYIITDKNTDLGYSSYILNENLKVYKNEDAYPIGYAANNVLNKQEFLKLNYPSTVVNLLKSIVVDSSSTVSPVVLEKSNPALQLISYKNLTYKKTDKGLQIHSEKKGRMQVKVNEDMKDKILFIRFKNNNDPACSLGDLVMTINDTMNKLTCKSWKYHNENFIFDYVLYNQDELNITFTKGFYDFSDIEFYLLDYKEVKNINREVDAFVISKEKTKGDKIIGSINVKEDGYFTIQIPYDKGFQIKVDGINVDYENVNVGFLGFPIKKGNHDIEIEYVAPYKKIGGIISVSGIILLIIYEVVEKKRKVKE